MLGADIGSRLPAVIFPLLHTVVYKGTASGVGERLLLLSATGGVEAVLVAVTELARDGGEGLWLNKRFGMLLLPSEEWVDWSMMPKGRLWREKSNLGYMVPVGSMYCMPNQRWSRVLPGHSRAIIEMRLLPRL